MSNSNRLARANVPVEQTWDLTDLFSTREQWEEELTLIQEDVAQITQYKNQLGSNADTLFNCLVDLENFEERIIKAATYASLKTAADGTDPQNQNDQAKIASVIANISAQLTFIETEILTIPEKLIEEFLATNPALQTYRKMLMDLQEKKAYTLSPEVEKVLASLGEVHDAPYMIYSRSKAADMDFAPITDEKGQELPMSFALYEDRYEISPNNDLRRKAYESFTTTLKRYQHTYAATYATEITKQVTLSRLRNYDSVTDMLLQPQQVTQDMYHQQLDIIQQELAPHMRKYIRLKQKLLGLDEMKICDLQVPIDPNYHPTITYQEATETILDALQVMGDDYVAIMKKAIDERWIDYADNIGKATGAFCSSPYGAHPYILITWTDMMRGTFVLAHELGHAGHFYLAGQHQTLLNTRPSTYFVEAPSTLNEILLAEHLLSHMEDPQMKRWVIDQLLGTYYHNFVTHLLEGELQRRVYTLAEEGTPITATVLSEQKKDLLEKFWGDTVTIDEGASLTWMRQPHYYMGLYPYTYSAGLTVATAVGQQIKEEGKPAVDRWLDVLKAGGTKRPLELIKQAGIDMSKPDAVYDAVAYVGSLIDQLIDSFQDELA